MEGRIVYHNRYFQHGSVSCSSEQTPQHFMQWKKSIREFKFVTKIKLQHRYLAKVDFQFQVFSVRAKKPPQAKVLYLPTLCFESQTLSRPLKFSFKWIPVNTVMFSRLGILGLVNVGVQSYRVCTHRASLCIQGTAD